MCWVIPVRISVLYFISLRRRLDCRFSDVEVVKFLITKVVHVGLPTFATHIFACIAPHVVIWRMFNNVVVQCVVLFLIFTVNCLVSKTHTFSNTPFDVTLLFLYDGNGCSKLTLVDYEFLLLKLDCCENVSGVTPCPPKPRGSTRLHSVLLSYRNEEKATSIYIALWRHPYCWLGRDDHTLKHHVCL